MITTGDLGPNSQEPWHYIYVGTAPAMAVFHNVISRAKGLGYNPLSTAQQALFDKPESLPKDKTSNSYELAVAMAQIMAGTDPVSILMKSALSGSFLGVSGETHAKLGYTSRVVGVVSVIGDTVVSAYSLNTSEPALRASVTLAIKAIQQ
jgi:hypothetical protein